ncbi:RNA 2',3'-cyclic phosphodiesterase [Blastococcus sp. MG754426]|uniref:RNA 2',3'-cyclic phosphodiesterase n=1 Tax=Blastococcus sp. MG754426 TaxID=2570317 RepID=UPI0027E1F2C9|nr:RNA 2',3'-cyclic phosphodiesterase [Blastococcus sp. MG754426]MCF6506147.1 RNA 2',3'-cyclic phosphodiesterase [Blastococcus sp. MG754426]MCF6510475.1 RNA 2',3'-cyclic phosphodiesterase [Blastococcus sp. MG754427]
MTAGATRRLFFAVDPPDPARRDLERALGPLRDLPGAPRWGRPERWHLTLLFLGAVPEPVVPRLVASAAPAVAATPPMALRLAGGGRFGSLRRPQVAWTGLEGDVEPLVALAGRLAAVARTLGLPVEDRPFRPHLTLGRWRPGRPADGTVPDRLAGYRGPEWPVQEIRLWESRLGPAPAYTVIAAWPLVR